MEKPNENAVAEAMRLAGTPAGQQLIHMLQRSGGDDLRQAMASAAAGDFEKAKKALTMLLNDPEAKKLLERLGR